MHFVTAITPCDAVANSLLKVEGVATPGPGSGATAHGV